MTGFFSNYFEQSEIDKVLTSETCTLDAVLESPDCFQECMSGNAGLVCPKNLTLFASLPESTSQTQPRI